MVSYSRWRKAIIKIKPIEGKYVFLDEKIYENEEFTDAVMNSDAQDYWGGDECIENKKIAVLFEGVFRVEEEIDFNTIVPQPPGHPQSRGYGYI